MHTRRKSNRSEQDRTKSPGFRSDRGTEALQFALFTAIVVGIGAAAYLSLQDKAASRATRARSMTTEYELPPPGVVSDPDPGKRASPTGYSSGSSSSGSGGSSTPSN